MTSKEKAEDLYWTYYQKVADGSSPEYIAKQCALIAVDEILYALSFHSDTELGETYWQEVKQEIEKL